MKSDKSLIKRFLPLLTMMLALVLAIAITTTTIAYYVITAGSEGSDYNPANPTDPSFTNPTPSFRLYSDDNKMNDVYIYVPDQGYPVFVRAAIIITWQRYAPCTCNDPVYCEGCPDCPDCEEDCEYCKDCDMDCPDCAACAARRACEKCEGCQEDGCDDCDECKEGDCSSCEGCLPRAECEDCEYCPNCEEDCLNCEEGCSDCSGCAQKFVECKDCEQCKDGNCEDCTNCENNCTNCAGCLAECGECANDCEDCEDCPKCNGDESDDYDVYFITPKVDTDYTITFGNNWEISGNFYYYTLPVESIGDVSKNRTIKIDSPLISQFEFLKDDNSLSDEGWFLNVEIVVQTIQAIGYTDEDENGNEIPAWQDAWGVTRDEETGKWEEKQL